MADQGRDTEGRKRKARHWEMFRRGNITLKSKESEIDGEVLHRSTSWNMGKGGGEEDDEYQQAISTIRNISS